MRSTTADGDIIRSSPQRYGSLRRRQMIADWDAWATHRHLFGETDFQKFSRVLPRKKIVRWRSIRLLPDTRRVTGRGLELPMGSLIYQADEVLTRVPGKTNVQKESQIDTAMALVQGLWHGGKG